MSKRDAEIYRKAAEDMDRGVGYGCCKAIAKASNIDSYRSTIQNSFASIFSPSAQHGWYWWTDEHDWNNPRVIALLFAAAMAESGDL